MVVTISNTNKTVDKVPVSTLRIPPIQTRTISQKLVQIVSTQIKSKQKLDLPTIMVGRVNSTLYIMSHFETIQALIQTDTKVTVNAIITDYTTMNDLLVSHVRENFTPQAIDPVKLRQILRYMLTKGDINESKACDLLWVDKRPELRNAIQVKITDKAMSTLLQMLDEISQKMYFVVTPTYYLTKIAKIDPNEQADAALELKTMTVPRMLSDQKSTWPNFDIVETTLKRFHKIKTQVPTENRVSKYDDDTIKNLGKKKTSAKAGNDTAARITGTAKPSKNTIKNAQKYIATDPNLIYIHTRGDHPDLLVHKKTGRTAIAQEKNGLYSITDDLGGYTHVLPDHISKYMDLDNQEENGIFIGKFPTIKKAQAALAKVKRKDQRCLTITYVPLGR